MKLVISFSGSSRRGSPKPNQGFTLPEILIALTVFMLVLAGIISANLFGLRMFQVNQNKLSATEWSRRTFGKITEEIQACNSVSILNVDTNGNFTGLLPGEPQQGNALQIYPTTNTANYTIYFVNLPDETFRQTVTASGTTNTVILADSVTNAVVFTAPNVAGLTNNQNDQLIHIRLEFFQPEHSLQNADNYRMETAVTRRALP
jgi:prepilin-type N-terminal cleavage/methylation domain-containing protein